MAVQTQAAQGEWENGLFDQVCGGDCGTCWASWCCAPCLFGRTTSRYERFPSQDGDATNFVNAGCGIFYLASCCGVSFLPLMLKRGEIRNRFNIHGDGATDCLLSCCCMPCSLAQMETEMKSRATGGATSAAVNDPYASSQGGMLYQAPESPLGHEQSPGPPIKN